MPQLARVISSLERLESQAYVLTDLASRRANADACRQLLTDLKLLRDRCSLRAYMELYERAVSLERGLQENNADDDVNE